jgi:hypothetical protein
MATPHCDYYSVHEMLGLGASVLRFIRLVAIITATSNYASAGFNNSPTAAQYCSILLNIAQYCSILLNLSNIKNIQT